ncbi:SDR family NAD(P)-dependent oxidoreductase [Paracoccus cavernae]|uniref:SDR family NAD(P)-dependent oxidoreductase n=1 Tax=Paracoccus cavernae TaxID=1571207 RepID=A0ABT8D7E2_9RHOB|nr:SDR family NAD(P)-dependent oxidoreductase [Paracoccus cavernae]
MTGAGSGIGAAMAMRFAEAGYNVAVSARSGDALQEICDRISAKGGISKAFAMDVLDREGIVKTAQEIAGWRNGIAVLCNNAGLNTPHRRWDDILFSEWDAILDTNIKGAINVIAAVLPYMRAQRDGVIIHTSSWAGRFHAPVAGVPYGASKHALTDLSASLNAQEGANGIRSTALHPGEVATPLLLRRPGFDPESAAYMIQPEDMADLALHVAQANPNIAIHEITLAPVLRAAAN